MHRRKELRPKNPYGVREPQTHVVVSDSNDYIYRLNREHALQHTYVAKDRNPPNVSRKYSVSIVIEPGDPSLKPASYQDIQSETPITTSPYNYQPDSLIKDAFLYLNLRLRYARSCLVPGYRALLPVFSSAPMSEILTSPPTSCANPYILRKQKPSLLQVVAPQA